jgi:hypothetical protein
MTIKEVIPGFGITAAATGKQVDFGIGCHETKVYSRDSALRHFAQTPGWGGGCATSCQLSVVRGQWFTQAVTRLETDSEPRTRNQERRPLVGTP